MRLRNRFLLVTFGLLVFVILTPILVLFTSGYQVDWKNHKFVKTGALVVKTLPSKAEVYLDNKKIDGTTPETVRFLLPGNYNVRVEKDGYQSWTKRLSINPQFATWANFDRDFLALFSKKPEQISNIEINFASISVNNTEVAYIQNNQLNVYNVANQNIQNLGDVSSLSVPFTFTNNLLWNDAVKVLNYFRGQNTTLPFEIKTIKQVQADGSNMAILSGTDLFVIKGTIPTLIDKRISGFYLEGENLWYVQDQFLKEYNLRTTTTTTAFSNLPISTTAQIIRGEGNTFLILNNSLYTLNDTLEKIYDGAIRASYDTAGHELLFSDANEILLYNPQQKNTQLILRSISQISNPVLNTYTGYVFFENESKIKAIELDGRDHRNVYTILDLTGGNTNFTLTNDGSILTVFNNSALSTYRIR